MPVSKKRLNTRLSYVYTRYTYRDTDLLEDKHASQENLDMEFYRQMCCVTTARYDEIHRIITDVIAGRKPQNEAEEDMHLVVALYSRNLDNWDQPEKVKVKFDGSITDFVLGGEFLAACRNKDVLTDNLMIRINKDVCNRYFTLLCTETIK